MQVRVLHRVQEAVQAGYPVRQGCQLCQDGAPRPPPPQLPLLPARQGAGRLAEASQGQESTQKIINI